METELKPPTTSASSSPSGTVEVQPASGDSKSPPDEPGRKSIFISDIEFEDRPNPADPDPKTEPVEVKAEEVKDEKKPDERYQKKFKRFSSLIVKGIVKVNTTVFVPIHNQQVLSAYDVKIASAYLQKVDKMKQGEHVTLNDYEREIIQKQNNFIDLAVFDNATQTELEEDWGAWLNTVNADKEISPGKWLFFSMVMIQGPVIGTLLLPKIKSFIKSFFGGPKELPAGTKPAE